MKLGIVYNEKGKIVNHRSLIKVLFNPILRLIGFYIGTAYNTDNNKLYGPKLSKSNEKCNKLDFKKYKLSKGWRIEKRRILI